MDMSKNNQTSRKKKKGLKYIQVAPRTAPAKVPPMAEFQLSSVSLKLADTDSPKV